MMSVEPKSVVGDFKQKLFVGLAVAFVIELWRNYPVSKFIWSVLTRSWEWLSIPTAIPRGLLVIGVVGLLVACGYVTWQAFERRRAAGPAWRRYNSDTFEGIGWHWNYYSNGGATVATLTPICPVCGLELLELPRDSYQYQGEFRLRCEGCTFTALLKGHMESVKETVRRLIDRNQWFGAYPGGTGRLPALKRSAEASD